MQNFVDITEQSNVEATHTHTHTVSRCNNLSNPEGGRVRYTQGVTVGSVATYECDTGRVLEGNAQRTCQANGNWSGSEPTCGEYSHIGACIYEYSMISHTLRLS